MSDSLELCAHVEPGAWPWRVELVLDEQLGFTDAVVACRDCGQRCLLEMLDWRGSERVLRASVVDGAEADAVIHDLGRGSCDIGRAGAELHHFSSRARRTGTLVSIDMRAPAVVAIVPAPDGLPTTSWRNLACDGRWVDYARSKTEMVNE